MREPPEARQTADEQTDQPRAAEEAEQTEQPALQLYPCLDPGPDLM